MPTTVLGSGTVVPDPDRFCAAYFVESGDVRLLLDCGPGAVHRMARFDLPWRGIGHVVLSHFHTDHTGGLPFLFFALKHGSERPRRTGVQVLGPPGTGERFRHMAAAFGDHMTDPGFAVSFHELAPDDEVRLGDAVRLRVRGTPHTDASNAYRVEGPAGVVGYTGDTGYDDALGEFFGGVDALICECSVPERLAMDTHLTPSQAAALARRAAPGELVLTHVFPQLGVEAAERGVREAGWDGPLRVAADGTRLDPP